MRENEKVPSIDDGPRFGSNRMLKEDRGYFSHKVLWNIPFNIPYQRRETSASFQICVPMISHTPIQIPVPVPFQIPVQIPTKSENPIVFHVPSPFPYKITKYVPWRYRYNIGGKEASSA